MSPATTQALKDNDLAAIAREAVMASRHLDATVRILFDSVQHDYPGATFDEAWLKDLAEQIQRSALLVRALPVEEQQPCASV